MSVAAEDRVEPPPAAAAARPAAAEAELGAVFAAGAGLLASLRRVVVSVLALFAAEARVARASVALAFLAGIALVALSVSLWACVVALAGWALVLATHSLGIALAILVAVHVVLVIGLWFVLVHVVRQAGFPHARAELAALGQTLQRDVARFQRVAAPARDPDSAP